MIGSHLNSVPVGGNYDGLAGVIAGLAALSALMREGAAGKRICASSVSAAKKARGSARLISAASYCSVNSPTRI